MEPEDNFITTKFILYILQLKDPMQKLSHLFTLALDKKNFHPWEPKADTEMLSSHGKKIYNSYLLFRLTI